MSTPNLTVTPNSTAAPTLTAKPPNKVEGVHVTPTVRDSSPALEVAWQPVAGPGVTYTVKYSTDPGELNTPPERAFEEVGVSGTLTILTTLDIATTYYIWVMGVSDGGVGTPSDRRSGVTYSSKLYSMHHCRAIAQIVVWLCTCTVVETISTTYTSVITDNICPTSNQMWLQCINVAHAVADQ